jgi:hypothetical protein
VWVPRIALIALVGCDGVFGILEVTVPPDAAPDAAPVDAAATTVVGCSDGTREAFADIDAHPQIAGCSGGWSIPGVDTGSATGCPASGNTGPNAPGIGCSVSDLCAPGWVVCATPTDVLQRSDLGCPFDQFPGGTFFVTRATGIGNASCDGLGRNDLFGCGSLGTTPDPTTCAPLNRTSGDLCAALTIGGWACPLGDNEADVVEKREPDGGGALCCKI